MFAHRERRGHVDLAFTDRLGGVGRAAEDLDLALRDDAVIADSWGRVLAEFAPDGASRVDMRQVHGTQVRVVAAGTDPVEVTECDALVTDRSDVVLTVRVADCVPVLIADTEAGVIGAAHVGRAGLAHDVLTPTLAAMRDLGGTELRAWIGPHVCAKCYEVPHQMQQEVEAAVPGTAATTRQGTPSIDLAAGVRRQLAAAGVIEVDSVNRCTLESDDLHSFRRDGAGSGRMAGLIRLRGAR